ncbi:hypothetical protein AZF37_00990 [endosymbiont 'TC1' of Trimyema compressum]|uniref:hypothetical protein n=1 Tax=endosymbiont 'TC1' of Trimyema compressum TaxID=243899 RepID=UPI0007F15A05|nr:hypothetical protein [endosymbiont 'TC1' of Trimyema compressum]AMP19944.1 hypothetical protein AZF37_00990 [endosymbiont 'TC1' of Trimyema compressum]
MVLLQSGEIVSPSHIFILDDYRNAATFESINIDDYFVGNNAKTSAQISAAVSATGTGLFPNNSPAAVTEARVFLNIVPYYNLSFDLNRGSGT